MVISKCIPDESQFVYKSRTIPGLVAAENHPNRTIKQLNAMISLNHDAIPF